MRLFSSNNFLSVVTSLLLFTTLHYGAAKTLSDVLVDNVLAESATNISIGCPGIVQNTFVIAVEWRCRGKCGERNSNSLDERSLLKFTKESGTMRKRAGMRLGLEPEVFSLKFSPIQSEDRGQYICLINDRQLPDAVIDLKVLDVPTEPSRPMVTGFTSRSITLSWTKPRHQSKEAPITGYIVAVGWRPVTADEDSEFNYDRLEVRTNSTEPLFTVDGLEPYTVYSFTITAVNHVGKSTPSKNSYPAITLREKPTGKPRVTAAHNTSSTSLYLAWEPPNRTLLHGEFLGYVVSFRPRDMGQDSGTEVIIENSDVSNYTLRNLETYTQYLISLRVFNPEGRGPETIVVVMTDEGAPSRPRNLNVAGITDTSAQVSWWEPARANGVIHGYRVYFVHHNYTSVQTVQDNKSAIVETLTKLFPYTEYKVWVKAYTAKNEGKSSQPILFRTDVRPPGPPTLVNLTCQNGHTMFLKWMRPEKFYRTVDVYHVLYRIDGDDVWDRQIVETVNNTINHMMYLNNLTSNKIYDLRIQAGTRSELGDRIMHFGEFSQTHRILLQPGCEAMRTFSPRKISSTSGGSEVILLNLENHLEMIAGAVFGTLGLLLAVLAFLLWRRYAQENRQYYSHEKYYGPTQEFGGWDNSPDGEHAIPVHLFPKHVAELHADQDVGFSKEYEEVRADSCLDEYTAQEAQNPENHALNRYPNIVAYDHTRVRFRTIKGSVRDEYLNGNFVDGFRRENAFIATQGPLQATFPSFWKMIWEQKSVVIVMITNLFENGKPKCDLYWPDSGTERFGDFEVTNVREDVLAFYTLRTFRLKHSSSSKKSDTSPERTVYQYHFTSWPDHGVPSHCLPFVTFVRNSMAANPEDAGPVVVHCSAGVGRTGCYMVVDAMLRSIEARGDVNVFSYLKHIRRQRNHSVQTEEQYMFIHDSLVEVIEAGETHINKSSLPKYIHGLQCIDLTDDKNHPAKVLEKQYKLVTSAHPGKSQFSSAVKIFNQPKNRSPDILAPDLSRVFLQPMGDADASDYINATWMTGFFDQREFILTQHPLDNTMTSFWQMIWEQDVHLVIMLSSIDSQECRPFWPETPGQQIVWKNGFQQIALQLIDELETATRKSIKLSLQVSDSSSPREVCIFHSPSWPQQCSPLSTVFDLVKVVAEERNKFGGPIVVLDRYGGTQAATFCSLMSLWQQLHFEGGVDVFQVAKMYNYCRPGIWRSQDDYLFLYCVLEAFVTNNGTTIPSPVDMEQWKNGFQLNGCVRVSRVYTETVNKALNEHGLNDSLRIPPDGQESSALLFTTADPSGHSTSSGCSSGGSSS